MLNPRYYRYGLVLFMVMIWNSPCFAQETQEVDDQAKMILKQMSNFLANSKQFSFHNESTNEEVLNSGQKLQHSVSVDVLLIRPNRVWADIQETDNHKRFWYNGTNMTLMTVTKNFYATSPAPVTIDEALDYAMDKYDITIPMADFMYSNPYDVLMEKVQSGLYAGKQNINGIICHHLAFSQEQIDWQVFIEDGMKPVPRKFVITYKDEPSSPQYIAYLSEWDFSHNTPDQHYDFVPPVDAQKIEFLQSSDE